MPVASPLTAEQLAAKVRDALDGCEFHGTNWYELCETCDFRKDEFAALVLLERAATNGEERGDLWCCTLEDRAAALAVFNEHEDRMREAESRVRQLEEALHAIVDIAPGYTAERGSIWALDHAMDAGRALLASGASL